MEKLSTFLLEPGEENAWGNLIRVYPMGRCKENGAAVSSVVPSGRTGGNRHKPKCRTLSVLSFDLQEAARTENQACFSLLLLTQELTTGQRNELRLPVLPHSAG